MASRMNSDPNFLILSDSDSDADIDNDQNAVISNNDTLSDSSEELKITDIVNRNANGKTEVCVVTAGNVDAGKSTWIGVIKYNVLDDGKGLARSKVAKHPHEVRTGKTSDISCRVLQLAEDQEIVVADLCGHEKYLKTTLFGMTGWYPDYGVLIVAANTGFKKMTREHMGLLLYLDIPFIVVITRIDIAPPEIYRKAIKYMEKVFGNFGKTLEMANDKQAYDDFHDGKMTKEQLADYEADCDKAAIISAKKMKSGNISIPCVSVSNKTGDGIEISKTMMKSLEPREKVWKSEVTNDQFIFYVDEKFSPPGAGLVVSGVLKGKTFDLKNRNDEQLYIGPYNNAFLKINVRTLHNNTRDFIDKLENRQRGCFAFRVTEKNVEFGKSQVRKGMVISNRDLTNEICLQFKAEIKILNHSTTISKNYSPVIHCGVVTQTARIILEEDQILKMGDRAIVSFRFVDRAEFLEPGSLLFFREGTTRGVGKITEILCLKDDPDPNPAYQHRRRRRIRPRGSRGSDPSRGGRRGRNKKKNGNQQKVNINIL